VNERKARPSLGGRLLARYALTVVAILLALAFVLDRTLESMFLDDLTQSLAAQAEAVGTALPDDPEALQAETRSLGGRLGLRITIIGTDGVVLADSVRDPQEMENHGRRPEVLAALQGETGAVSRTSETTGEPYRYVALPQESGRVVRVALPLSIVQDRLSEVRTIIAVGTALAAAIGVLAVWLIARSLTRPLRRLTESVETISSGDLTARVPADGTAELALLGRTLNRMSHELNARVEELKRDRQRRDVILSAMNEGVTLVDARGSIGYANPAATRLLGSDSATLPASLRRLTDDARNEGTIQVGEIDIGLQGRTLQASAVPLQDPGDVLLVLRDITVERRLEAMRRDFVTDASHELKTPTAAMRAAAETVEKAIEDDPVAAKRFAEQLRRDAIRLSNIVSDLLDLSRLESERPALEPVRLDRVVDEAVRRSREQADEAGVTLDWKGDPVTIPGSREDLSLLVRNLLDNAVRYTPSGGRVSVEVGRDNGHATLSVEDTGIGIPTRDLPRIFERFYRVDRARSRDTGGTGLGLSIARHVVERHGGQIEAESELGRGSTFKVTLPAGAD
jgi:two-component system phosphate regulon sensor histidine kinase PhoR